MRISLGALRSLQLCKLLGHGVMVIVLGEREERFSEADTQDLGIWDST